MRYRFVMVVVMLLVASNARAATEHHVALVQKYIRMSGLEDTINSLPEMLVAMSEQNSLTSEHPEVDKMVTETMVETFDPQKILGELEQYLLAETDEHYLVLVLAWLETPLARKILREEKAAERSDNQAEMLRYLAVLREKPPARQRISLIQDLVATTQMAELASGISIRLIKGVLESVNMILPREKRAPGEKIEAHLRQVQEIIRSSLRQQMTLTSYYTYRNMSDAELRDYIAFYKGTTGQREIETTGGALFHVLGNWFSEAGQRLLPPVSGQKEDRHSI